MKVNVEIKSYLDWSDKGRSGFLFYVIGLILAFFFFVFGGAAVLPLSSINPDYQKSLPLNVLGTLLAFVLPFFAIPLIVKILHNRPSWSVAMPRFYFAKWDFFTGFWVSMVISLAFSWLLSITGVMPVETNPDFDIKQFLVVALIGFLGIFIQAGSEELLFRGYLPQFIRRFTSNKFIFIGIPALIFALPHIVNISDLGGTLWVAVPYMISGIFYGWFAYRTGSLWMSLGLHLSNNFGSLVFVGTKGDVLPSAAPFVAGLPSLTATTLIIAAHALVVTLILHTMIKRQETEQWTLAQN
jgi:membrane protease YdiL (CAAX protease family)